MILCTIVWYAQPFPSIVLDSIPTEVSSFLLLCGRKQLLGDRLWKLLWINNLLLFLLPHHYLHCSQSSRRLVISSFLLFPPVSSPSLSIISLFIQLSSWRISLYFIRQKKTLFFHTPIFEISNTFGIKWIENKRRQSQ